MKESSRVRHWLIGDRLPPENGPYLQKIAAALALSPDEARALDAAYAYSRALRGRPRRAPGGSDGSSIPSLFPRPSAGPAATTPPSEPIPPDLLQHRLPDDCIPLDDEEQIARMAIKMFLAAADRAIRPHVPTIYLTFNAAENFLRADRPGYVRLYGWFRQALRRALEAGCDVCQLMRLDHDIERSVGIVKMIRGYLGASGAYRPYYHARETIQAVPEGLCIVPDVGALVLFATKQAERVDAGYYLPAATSPRQVQLLIEHVRCFERTPGVLKPLLRAYRPSLPGDIQFEFGEALRRYEEDERGPIVVVRGAFPRATCPKRAWADGSTWLTGYTGADRLHREANLRARANALVRRLHTDPYRAICSMGGVRAFLERGIPARNDFRHLRETPTFTREERLAQLEQVIKLLQRFDTFELALLDEADDGDLVPGFWEAIGSRAVMIESFGVDEDAGPRGSQVNLEITEPTLVRAFHAYGDRLWEGVPPAQRDRGWVIWWLGQRRDRLKKS